MFKVFKNEPDFFINIKKKIKKTKENSAWSNQNIKNIRQNLALFILKEQKNLCVYCEKMVNDYPKDCHIDHFKKRDLFPNETLNYDNLFISCNNEKRCAKYKDRKILKKDYNFFINPAFEDPEKFLEYTFFGEIQPKENLDDIGLKKAKFTIDILNLNAKGLVEERKTIILSLCEIIDKLSLEQIQRSGFVNFFTLIKWLLSNKKICKKV